jgi:hypothetical protein
MATKNVKIENKKVEWISCLCGETIAACVDGTQDEEWIENRERYLHKGYTAEISTDQTKKFGKCRCNEIINWVKENHPKVYYKPGTQLKMF